MNSSTSVVKVSNSAHDDLFLCHAFAKAIASDKLHQIVQQQKLSVQSPIIELNALSSDSSPIVADSTPSDINFEWKVGDLCLCPYSEDGLLYKATIIDISPSTKKCTISFDDYGNEEIHELADLKIRSEEDEADDDQHQQPNIPSIDKNDLLIPPQHLPQFPVFNSSIDNDSLSSTLMSWYLAGYHTGFYQGVKDKKNIEK